MNDDDKTDPDVRSPYEHVLGELNAIKALCEATHAACVPRIARLEHWQLFSVVVSFAAFVFAACR
jgi:hypothetical protein